MATTGEVLAGWSLAPAAGYVGPEKPVAGVHGLNATSIGFSDEDLGRHVLFLGGIGTGKTVGMKALVASLRSTATPDDVFVVFDTKGDFHEAFFRAGDATLCVGDQSDFAGSTTWNLFSELRGVPESELVDEVNELAATLFEGVGQSAGDNNRFWTNMAQDLFAAVVICLARSERTGSHRYSNLDLRAVADKWDLETLRGTIGQHADLRGTLQYIANDGSNTTNSVLIFLQQMIRQTFSSSFRDRGDFSVREFVRGKGARALFLEFDVARATTLTPVFRTLIDTALKESLGRKHAAGRTFVIMDEFALLPQLRHMDAGVNFGRSLGLRFVVGTQNVGQVLDAYGPGLGNSILSAFGTLFTFRLFDHDSRTYVRNRFGTNRQLVRYDAALRTRGIGEQMTEGSVIEDWDLTDLGVGTCLAAPPGCPPVQFTFLEPL